MVKAPVLLAAVLVVCVASSADARRRHHHGYGGGYDSGERYSTRSSVDAWRRARDAQQGQGQDQPREQGRPRGDDRGQSSPQDSRGQNLGAVGAADRGQDLRQDREDRSRYDRRRTRNLDQWRRAQDSGRASGESRSGREDWRRAQDDRHSRDEWRRSRDERRAREREDVTRAAEPGDAALRRGRSGAFGAAIEKLARGCATQAAEFENWPFDSINETVGPDEAQRNALTALRNAANQAAQQLATGCPQDVPEAPAARLEAVEQGIDATLKAYDVVEPALQAFYGALNDEQKARLYRDMAPASSKNPPQTAQTSGRREAQESREVRDYSSRRQRWRDYAFAREEAAAREAAAAREQAAARNAAPRPSAPGWSGMCEELAAALRNWPVREIERDVRLAGAQRVAFYELVTSSLKAADTLSSACPAEAALTPVGRMQAMRQRLSAVRAATAAIRAPLARFYEALDQGQKLRFAGMS